MKVQLDPEARIEFNDALDYYLARSKTAAEEFIDEVDSARRRLSDFPQSGSPLRVGRIEFRRLVLPKFPYSLVYRVERDIIRVFAIAHHKRKPRYWRKRVRPKA